MTGSIKDYTTNFKFIIPEFNIATWHDYIEQNFRSIDALFQNLFGINGFSGMWKTNSQYTAGQVLFIGEDGGSIYEGRLVKVVNDTNTGGFSTFSEAIKANPKDYELYADASSAQIFSELARDWANKTDGTIITPEGDDTGEYSAKKYAQNAQSSATDSEYFKNIAQSYQEIAQSAATDAETSEKNSRIWAEGDDADVVSLGGTHSSMMSAGLSYSYANAPEDIPVNEWLTTHKIVFSDEPAKINGHNAITIEGGSGVILTQEGAIVTLTLDGYTKSEIDEMLGDVETLINAL